MDGLLLAKDYLSYAHLSAPFVIPILAGAACFYLAQKLNKIEVNRRNTLEKKDVFEPIADGGPGQRHTKKARHKALLALKRRFSLFRRGLFTLFLFGAALLAVLPLLTKLEATYISFLLALLSMVVGFAAKPMIENYIAGMVISFGGRVRAGDTITIDGQYGSIEAIHQTYSIIKIWNWTKFIIPNSQLLQKSFINHTHQEKFIWAHLEFVLDLDTDLDLVERICQDSAKKSSYYLHQFEPSFWVMGFTENGVKCWFAAWVNSPDAAFSIKSDISRGMAQSFRSHQIRCHKISMLPSTNAIELSERMVPYAAENAMPS